MAPIRFVAMAACVGFCAASPPSGPVLVTGATGRTGSAAYRLLKSQGVEVRALVRNVTKAQELLGCTACDESDGIYVGDVTSPSTLDAPMSGASGLVILTSSHADCDNIFHHCSFPHGQSPADVDWKGQRNQIEAFAKSVAASQIATPMIALVSAMGTTHVDSPFPGHSAFYKLNAEAALMSSRIPFAIVKPCGLVDGAPATRALLVDHDDAMYDMDEPTIARGDVARLLVAALAAPDVIGAGVRFDVCSTAAGAPTADADLVNVLRNAQYPWQGSGAVRV